MTPRLVTTSRRALPGIALTIALLHAPGDAHATVSCVDLHTFAPIPSGAVHVLSLSTSAIGLGVSEARRGWYNAAIATVATNYVQSLVLVTTDAALDDGCGDQVSELNMVVEGVALAATSGLLTAVLIVEPRDVEDETATRSSLVATVAPRQEGALAILAGTF